MDWVSAAIEEYKTLRSESLTSMQTQQSVLRYGITSLAIMIAAGFNVWSIPPLPELIFLVFVPLVSYLVLITWMGEIARMMRAGLFLTEIEKKINGYFAKEIDALTWENWQRKTENDKGTLKQKNKKTPQLIWNYIAIIFLFLFTAGSAVIVGNIKFSERYSACYALAIDVIEAIFFSAVTCFILWQGKRFRDKPAQ